MRDDRPKREAPPAHTCSVHAREALRCVLSFGREKWVMAVAGVDVEINFCPWCGHKLRDFRR